MSDSNISNVVAWMGSCRNGGATIATTDPIQVDKWKNLGLTISPLIKQPAELAAHEGDARAHHELVRKLTAMMNTATEGNTYILHEAITALAATGKQQVGEVQGDALTPWKEVRTLSAAIVKNLDAFAASPHKAAWCGLLDDSLMFADMIEKSASTLARQPEAQKLPRTLVWDRPGEESVYGKDIRLMMLDASGKIMWCGSPNGADRVAIAAGSIPHANETDEGIDLVQSHAVLAEVAAERARQEAKWGQQNHADWTRTTATSDLAGVWPGGVGSHFKWITDYKAAGKEGHALGYFDILMEEVAEAHDEARVGNIGALREEVIQVAAVAVAWVECIDRRLSLTDQRDAAPGVHS